MAQEAKCKSPDSGKVHKGCWLISPVSDAHAVFWQLAFRLFELSFIYLSRYVVFYYDYQIKMICIGF